MDRCEDCGNEIDRQTGTHACNRPERAAPVERKSVKLLAGLDLDGVVKLYKDAKPYPTLITRMEWVEMMDSIDAPVGFLMEAEIRRRTE